MSVFGFVVVLVYLAFSKYGATKLGPPTARPSSRITPDGRAALPFIFVLYAMVWMLFRELAADRRAQLEQQYEASDQTPVGASLEEARQLMDD